MTIDTARCETCGHTKFDHAGPDWSNAQGCCEDGCECRKFVGPDCTEPAPSAGVSQAEKLADAARSLCSVHGSDPVAYVAARLADVERYYGESQLREITLKKRIAELESRQPQSAEWVRVRESISDLSDLLMTVDQRREYYTLDEYQKHHEECRPPRGDQSCKCRLNNRWCNMDQLLDELTTGMRVGNQGERIYVGSVERAISTLRALLPKESDNG